METNKHLTSYLKQLLRLLKKEKKALVKNDGVQIEKIVKQKEQLVEPLNSFKGIPSVEEKKLIAEIKQVQNDNLLLTKQAIAFNDRFLSAVGTGMKKANSTYSSSGRLASQEDLGFINHSM